VPVNFACAVIVADSHADWFTAASSFIITSKTDVLVPGRKETATDCTPSLMVVPDSVPVVRRRSSSLPSVPVTTVVNHSGLHSGELVVYVTTSLAPASIGRLLAELVLIVSTFDMPGVIPGSILTVRGSETGVLFPAVELPSPLNVYTIRKYAAAVAAQISRVVIAAITPLRCVFIVTFRRCLLYQYTARASCLQVLEVLPEDRLKDPYLLVLRSFQRLLSQMARSWHFVHPHTSVQSVRSSLTFGLPCTIILA
jgi:hypothetical protein